MLLQLPGSEVVPRAARQNTRNGAATGEFDYLKPSRVKGIVQCPEYPPSEFVIVDDALFIRRTAPGSFSPRPVMQSHGDPPPARHQPTWHFWDMGVSDQAVVKKEATMPAGATTTARS